MDPDLQQSMITVLQARVFFGHQSVGANILAGIEALCADSSLPRIAVVPADGKLAGMRSYLAQQAIGQNGQPKTKCDAFAAAVESLASDSLQLALMKFCFTDFGPGTDVDGLFAYYTATIARVQSEFPKLKIVHVTAPLLSQSPGWKRAANWILGRESSYKTYDTKISRFNRLLASEYGHTSLFDLAQIESTFPDGSRCTIPGTTPDVYALVSDYSTDGGHLDDVGRKLAAVEFLRVIGRELGGR